MKMLEKLQHHIGQINLTQHDHEKPVRLEALTSKLIAAKKQP